MERDLLEKILTAQVLLLAQAMQGPPGQQQTGLTPNRHDFAELAAKKVKEKQADIIRLLLAAESP